MGVSAALGIEGYKQFQLPPIIFYIAGKKGVQNNATNTQLKYPQSHSCAQYHRKLLKCLWGFQDEVPARSGSPMGSGSAGGMQKFAGASREERLLQEGQSTCIIYILHSVFCCLFQFQLQKGSCLKKYFILQNFHGVFINFF